MPRLPEQNQAIKDKRRAKLLDSALKVFMQKDYRDVTIDDITRVAKCSHGLFYHYFPSLEAMFIMLYHEIICRSKIDKWVNLSNELHGAEGLKQICKHIEEGQVLNGKDLNVLLAVIRLFGNENGATNADFQERYNLHPTFIRLIREGQEEGLVIDGNPEEIERAFFTLATAALNHRRNGKKVPEAPITAETLYKFLLKA